MKNKKVPTQPFLLEIGTEELPSDAIQVLRNELKSRVYKWLDEKNLLERAPSESAPALYGVNIEITPRRIVIFIEDVLVTQMDKEEEIFGPTVKAAFSENNEPTKALLGFLKSKGAKVGDVLKKETPRGECVAIHLKTKGVKTEKLLKNFLSEIFHNFPFPKTMRWNTDIHFPRPVRWILALWGSSVLPFEYAGLKSGRLTHGHRFLSDKTVSIKKASLKELEAALKRLHVVLSFEERCDTIRKVLLKTNPMGKVDEDLIRISASLTEDPVFIKGNFDKRYLRLPEEILATSMKKHQKIFAVYDKNGRLQPTFVTVMNGKKRDPKLIQKNYENVLDAKLKDAEFFYEEDAKSRLEDKVESLKKVTFLGKLGTLYEKTERLIGLSKELSEELSLTAEEKNSLERAAKLSKADLVTHMVYEFPELQGFAGAEYAKKDGENDAVWNALKDYYLPISAGIEDSLQIKKLSDSSLSCRKVGGLLGILDKIDTLVGALGMGIEVKGSEDPYALRRAANGIVLTVFEFKKKGVVLSFSLEKIILRCIELYGDKLKLSKDEILGRLKRLLEERILWILSTERARDKEFLTGIFRSSSDRLMDIWDKFYFLVELEKKDTKSFYQAFKILERTSNILKGAKGITVKETVDPQIFQADEERTLFEAFSEIVPRFKDSSYEEATKLYAEKLYDRIHTFFDKVLVNDKDESLRQNRLALMHCIYSLYTRKIADLSVITQMEPLK